MPCIGVLFELRCAETRPGETICVVGNIPELGGWDCQVVTRPALQLRTSNLTYPHWAMLRPIWLELAEADVHGKCHLEYKFVRDQRLLHKGSAVRWEDSIPNRSLALPAEDGAIFLVSDAVWSSKASPTRVRRTTMSEVRSRWGTFDPQWAAAQKLRVQAAAPVMFNLSPRTAQAEGTTSTEASPARLSSYSIEEEFHALSPTEVHGVWNEAPARVGPKPRGLSVTRRDSAKEAPEMFTELEALRLENATLRERLRQLSKANAIKVESPSRRPVPPLNFYWMSKRECESRSQSELQNTSNDATPVHQPQQPGSEAATRFGKANLDAGPISPGGGPAGGWPEPQEEPQVEEHY